MTGLDTSEPYLDKLAEEVREDLAPKGFKIGDEKWDPPVLSAAFNSEQRLDGQV